MSTTGGESRSDLTHADDTTLIAWVAGKLPEHEAQKIEGHLETCDACAERLDQIPPTPDPFVQKLRNAAGLTADDPVAPVAPVAPPAESAPTDANLLFGALALQSGLITAQQLADGCSLWASRRGTPLSDLMIDQGWIDAEDKASVMTLLAARLGKESRRSAEETLSGRDSAGGGRGETLSLSPLPGERLRLQQLHSQGGIGQVWRATDTLLGREVALKELLPELRGSKRHRERFFREARVAAQLAHPGTAPVYEYREEGGRCYYTMKFYSGRTLTESVKRAHEAVGPDGGSVPFLERLFPLLEHFLVVCDTIAYAHSKGIVHRDLKGENIVLGEFGEVTVIDWGLAKSIGSVAGGITPSRHDANTTPTLDGERLGTPGFMAPEQARGDLAAIDERTDVYGLSAVLYEILTMRAPFSGETANEVMHRVETAAPTPPTEITPDTPSELEAICLRGLSKLREDRFASAADLRDAVRTWLTDQVHRRRESDRQSKFFSLSHDLFVALDDRGRITQVNPAYENYFGYDGRKSAGKLYSESIHPDDAARAKKMFDDVQRGLSQQDTVIRIRANDGTFRPVSWTVTRVPGEPTMYAVGRPQDDESQLRRLAEERARFFALSRDLCVALDSEGRHLQVNQAWIDYFGYSEERALAGDPFSKIHPDDAERVHKALRQVRDGQSVQDVIARVEDADGRYRPANWTLTRIAGEDTMYAIGRPIDEASERRRTMESRAQFFALSPDLFVIADERGHAAQVNAAWSRLLGWDEAEVIGHPFRELVHPDDVARASRAGRRALLRDAVVGFEVRMRHRDGDYRHVAWTLCRVPGDKVNYAIGRDITESKRAEDRLRAILDSGQEALLVVSVEGRIEFANQTLCRLFGYERGEIEGQPFETLMPEEFHKRHRTVFADYMRQPLVRSMGRGAAFPAEHKDGSPMRVQINLSPLHLSSGELSILAAVQPTYEETTAG